MMMKPRGRVEPSTEEMMLRIKKRNGDGEVMLSTPQKQKGRDNEAVKR